MVRRKKKRTVKKENNRRIVSSKATDDMYYLRWNPNGNYDSDDDWWNDVVASKGKEHKENRKREKRVKAAAARVLEEALYQRYKYHTAKVMKWGNTLWADRYSGQRSNGDTHNLSLQTVMKRLKHL